jgi:hypothetical protein
MWDRPRSGARRPIHRRISGARIIDQSGPRHEPSLPPLSARRVLERPGCFARLTDLLRTS